jgi:hypothetical protein
MDFSKILTKAQAEKIIGEVTGKPNGPFPKFSELTPPQLQALRGAFEKFISEAPKQKECSVCAPLRRMGLDSGCSKCDFEDWGVERDTALG